MSTDFEVQVPTDVLDQLDTDYAAAPVRVKGADTEPGVYQAQFKGVEIKQQKGGEGKPDYTTAKLIFQLTGPPEAIEEDPLGNECTGFYPLGTEVGRSIFKERALEMGVARATFRETVAALAAKANTFWEIKVTHTKSKKDESRVFQNIYIRRELTS